MLPLDPPLTFNPDQSQVPLQDPLPDIARELDKRVATDCADSPQST